LSTRSDQNTSASHPPVPSHTPPKNTAIMSKTFAAAEVSKHKDKDNGLWLIIEGNVYDVTSK
jgi:cytochrome b involved in lipid metabolism